MRTVLFSLFIMTIFFPVYAQTATETAQSINLIKRDTMFIYAEATMKDLNEAYNGARSILEIKVGDWVRKQYPNEGIEVCIVKAKDHFLQLETRRGDFYRAFVYVRKSDIMPVSDKSEVTVFEVAPITKPNQPLGEPTIIVEEEAPIQKKDATYVLSADEKLMVAIKNLPDLNTFVKKLRDNHRLNGYGKLSTKPKDKDCYIFVCNESGTVVACFHQQSNGTCINLSTLQSDAVENYHNGAVWFQIKEQ